VHYCFSSQNLKIKGLPYLVTLNPSQEPKHIVDKWYTSHPVPSPAAAAAAKQFDRIQGKRGIWFCGAYQGYGFHEDGFKAGLEAANGLLGAEFMPLPLVPQMLPTYLESISRLVVIRFLSKFVCTGEIQLLESGGTVFNCIGDEKGCALRCKLRILRPAFYWKIATRQDLGLADAYVDGDFTCVDEQDGLLNFLQIMIANRDINRLSAGHSFQNRRGWTRPLLLTSAMDSAISYLRHLLRSNTLTNSRRNISQHYDLVQIFFSLPFCCCQMDILHHSDMRKCHIFVVFLWVSTHIFCKAELEPRSPEIHKY
jgi:cyclopropane-fatty-acyl-phospholipid synthase